MANDAQNKAIHAGDKKKVDMGKHPEIRLEAMENAYKGRGRSVPLRYKVAADEAMKKRGTSDGHMRVGTSLKPTPKKLSAKEGGEKFDKLNKDFK